MTNRFNKLFFIPDQDSIPEYGKTKFVPNFKIISTCRYQHFQEIKGIYAYVVNVHDASNYDLDICFNNPETKNIYNSVISHEYTYLDDNGNKITSQAYRCRLKGLATKIGSSFESTQAVKELIDENDGWVECSISDIDIYHRLLVDIKIGDNHVNDYLIKNFPNNYRSYKKFP